MMLGSLQWIKLTKNKIPKTMKKLFYLLLMCVSFTLSAQSVKLSTKVPSINSTVNTNIPVGKLFNLDVKTPKSQAQVLEHGVKTSNIAIYKGVRYEVYVTQSGKLFIPIPTKDGLGYYRKYIKTE